MKKKINASLLLISIIAIILTGLLGTIVTYQLFQSQLEADLASDADILRDSGLFDDPSKSSAARFSFGSDEIRITWIDKDGTVLYDNRTDASELPSHANRPEFREALEKGSGTTVRRSDTLNKSTFYYALLLPNQTVIRVAKVKSNMLSLFEAFLPGLLAIIALAILFSIALAHFLTKSLVSPIDTMAENIGSSMEPPYPELVPFANKIRAQHEDILKSAKMRQDFTANVSHELKTPLTAISGYAELIENGMASGSDVTRFAGEIQSNARRLLSLINDIIKLSQLDNFEDRQPFEKVDLDKIARCCVDNLQVSAGKNKVHLYYEGKPAMVLGREEMLSELVTNLCDNAIRYNYPGGYVKVSVYTEEGQSVLVVKDNGIGIPKEQQDRVSERFYRVDKSRSKKTGGTGLGLALVKHIVLLHNASLTLDSAPGVGTTITVRF